MQYNTVSKYFIIFQKPKQTFELTVSLHNHFSISARFPNFSYAALCSFKRIFMSTCVYKLLSPTRNTSNTRLFDYMNKILSFLASPICAVYLLAVFWPRTNEPVSHSISNNSYGVIPLIQNMLITWD